MLKTYVEILNDEQKNFLESLSYEVESRKSLLGFLSENDNTNQTFLNQLFSEYQDFFIQYELAKNEFENSYVKKKYKNVIKWNLTFYNNELTITTQESDD